MNNFRNVLKRVQIVWKLLSFELSLELTFFRFFIFFTFFTESITKSFMRLTNVCEAMLTIDKWALQTVKHILYVQLVWVSSSGSLSRYYYTKEKHLRERLRIAMPLLTFSCLKATLFIIALNWMRKILFVKKWMN